MILCPNCCHSLKGLRGQPDNDFGEFTEDVRCPECSFVVPAGARVVVGAAAASMVGARLPWSVYLCVGFVAFSMLRSTSDAVFSAMHAFSGGGSLDRRSIFYLLVGVVVIGVIGWSIVGMLALGRERDPAVITEDIAAKQRWLISPGSLRSFAADPATPRFRLPGFGSAASKESEARTARSDAEVAGRGACTEASSHEIRGIDVRVLPTRKGIHGKAVRLMAQYEGQRGAASTLHIVTAHDPHAVGEMLLATLRRAGEPASAAGHDAAAAPRQAPSRTNWSATEIVLHGSPFEPRLIADETMLSYGIYRRWAWIPFLLAPAGLSLILWVDGYEGYGIMACFLAFCLMATLVYGRWRSSPARWTARPGELCIERFTWIIPGIGPSRRRIAAAQLGGVAAVERDGMVMLAVTLRGRKKPCAILVPSDLGGRAPVVVAEAVEGLVRFGTTPPSA